MSAPSSAGSAHLAHSHLCRKLQSVWFIWDTLFHFLPEALARPEMLPPVERVPQRLRVGGADGVPLGNVHRRVEVDGVVAWLIGSVKI